MVRAGRQEVENLTEGNSREWRKSQGQLCQTAKTDAAVLEATVALLLRSRGEDLQPGSLQQLPQWELEFCWQSHSPGSPVAAGSLLNHDDAAEFRME